MSGITRETEVITMNTETNIVVINVWNNKIN